MPTVPLADNVGLESGRNVVAQVSGDCLSSRESYVNFRQRVTSRRNDSATASTVLTITTAALGTISTGLATALVSTATADMAPSPDKTLTWLTFGTTVLTALAAIPTAILAITRESQSSEFAGAETASSGLDAALTTLNSTIQRPIRRLVGQKYVQVQ